jgi:UDP-N-acetylmuramoyl-tripeptide--D-alanyl-D-alanine ligase
LGEIARVVDGHLDGANPATAVNRVSTDSRRMTPGALYFAIRGERFDGHAFVRAAVADGACACVVRHDFAAPATLPLLRVSDVTLALGQLAAHHRRSIGAKVIGVTGSNGKTTTKDMLVHVLGTRLRGRGSIKSYNNQIGVPLTLLECDRDDEFLVVEIGSNAPGEVAGLAAMAAPDYGVITSIGAAHLAGFGGIEGVRREKMSLISRIRPGGMAVVNAAAVSGMGVFPRAGELRWITFGDHPDADVRVTDICGDLHHTFAAIEDRHVLRLKVAGAHNAVNAAGVFTVCRHMGMGAEDILAALATFKMPPLRMIVRRVGGMTIIDDCYNANPASMEAAIRVLGESAEGRRVLVVGEMAELGTQSDFWHRRMGEVAANAGVELVVAVGARAHGVAAVASGGEFSRASGTSRGVCCEDVEEALRFLPDQLREGDTILIKGSRSAGLERVAIAIEKSFGGNETMCAAGSRSGAAVN